MPISTDEAIKNLQIDIQAKHDNLCSRTECELLGMIELKTDAIKSQMLQRQYYSNYKQHLIELAAICILGASSLESIQSVRDQ